MVDENSIIENGYEDLQLRSIQFTTVNSNPISLFSTFLANRKTNLQHLKPAWTKNTRTNPQNPEDRLQSSSSLHVSEGTDQENA
jgi:hypothetical protein